MKNHATPVPARSSNCAENRRMVVNWTPPKDFFGFRKLRMLDDLLMEAELETVDASFPAGVGELGAGASVPEEAGTLDPVDVAPLSAGCRSGRSTSEALPGGAVVQLCTPSTYPISPRFDGNGSA
jgi:hypothetical protein